MSGGLSIQPPATAQKQFEEISFSGSDAITLQTGHSYAFGLVIGATADFSFERASGLHTYTDGTSFVGNSPGLSSSGNVGVSPYSGAGSRDWFIGVYAATPVPEPGSLALLGVAAVTGGLFLRRRRTE